MRAVPLICCRRALPILIAWADSVGNTLDVCPLATAKSSWVYIAGRAGRPFKVGFTMHPGVRPFTCWRDYGLTPDTYPLVMISGADRGVERLVKRAGYPFALTHRHWNSRHAREAFEFESPLRDLVAELRAASDACFYESPWMHAHPRVVERELSHRRWQAEAGAA